MIIYNLFIEVPKMAVGDLGWTNAAVFLNGEYQDKCVFADAERGLVKKLRVNEDNEVICEQLVYGKVKIIIYPKIGLKYEQRGGEDG
jgi:hypothetical protein